MKGSRTRDNSVNAVQRGGLSGTNETATDNTASGRQGQVPVLLHHDYWDKGGIRHVQGTVVTLDLVSAKMLIAAGKASRADPFPGENF